MEFLKNIFGDKSMTYDEFKAAVEADKTLKIVNLTDGNYVDKNKFDEKVSDLKAANETITQLKNDSEDVEKMKQTIADYETKERKRLDDEKAATELEALKNRFSSLKGNNSFLNEGTESWIFSEFQSALALDENKGKSDKEIYDAVTKDKNIYTNPNQVFINPPAGGGEGAKKAEFKRFF